MRKLKYLANSSLHHPNVLLPKQSKHVKIKTDLSVVILFFTIADIFYWRY